MKTNIQSSISRFLLDRLKRSTDNKLTLSETFIFSFLLNQSNFQQIFLILYSAFQNNLIENPGEFKYWIPESNLNYPETLEFITITNDDYKQIQNEHSNLQNQLENLEKEEESIRQLGDYYYQQFNDLQSANSNLQREINKLTKEKKEIESQKESTEQTI
jgi:uncharacterized protein YukE